MPLVAAASGGYLAALLQTLVALAGVSALAVLVLRWAARRGLGRAPAGRRLELLERLPLEHGATLNLVRVDDREWVVGSSPGRSPTLVADLSSVRPPRGAFRQAYADAGAASSLVAPNAHGEAVAPGDAEASGP